MVFIIFIATVILVFVFRAQLFSGTIPSGTYRVISQGVCQNGISYTVKKCESLEGKPCIDSKGNLSFDYELVPINCIPPISETVFSTSTPLDVSYGECIFPKRCLPSGEKGTKLYRYYSTEGIKRITSNGVKISGGLHNISSMGNGDVHTLLDGTVIEKRGDTFFINEVPVTKSEALQRSLYFEEEKECTPSLPTCGIHLPCISTVQISAECPNSANTPFSSGYSEYPQQCVGVCETDEICHSECIRYIYNYPFTPDFEPLLNSFIVVGTTSKVETSTKDGDIFLTGVGTGDIPKIGVYSLLQLVNSTPTSITVNRFAIGRYTQGWVNEGKIGDQKEEIEITISGGTYYFNGVETDLLLYPFDNEVFEENTVYKELVVRYS